MPGFLYDTYNKIQVTFKQVLKTSQVKDLMTKTKKQEKKKWKVRQHQQTFTWEIFQGQKRLGKQACHLVWQRPSSMRRTPLPRSSVPEPWQSWHTRRRGRRCRTAGRSGICGKWSLHRRRQKGTQSQGTALSWDWSCSSARTHMHTHRDIHTQTALN